ncbi:hypothetical protein GF068_37915 [Polyangium spumosum]|uniref:Uncharacterized protein n=1 Tax=Polyangium spumosum TaxID=889282 RepID=A0A6N7Q461_9BACT|nr:hypothetical protein [Polyangium spumosum]
MQKRDAQRHALLRAVYEMANGEPGSYSYEGLYKCSESIGLSREETDSAFEWLVDRDLLARFATGYFELTRYGADEIEDSLRHPEKETEHFAPIVNMNIYGGNVGAIHTGRGNIDRVAQQVNAAATSDVLALFDKLRAGLQDLPPEKREEAKEIVDAFQEQATSAKPKMALIRSYANTLNEYLLAYGPTISTLVELCAKNSG